MKSRIPESVWSLRDHTAMIALDRPEKLNAVTGSMSAELKCPADRCNNSDEVRAVILTGAGERAFCAGSDITEPDAYATPWDSQPRRLLRLAPSAPPAVDRSRVAREIAGTIHRFPRSDRRRDGQGRPAGGGDDADGPSTDL